MEKRKNTRTQHHPRIVRRNIVWQSHAKLSYLNFKWASAEVSTACLVKQTLDARDNFNFFDGETYQQKYTLYLSVYLQRRKNERKKKT